MERMTGLTGNEMNTRLCNRLMVVRVEKSFNFTSEGAKPCCHICFTGAIHALKRTPSVRYKSFAILVTFMACMVGGIEHMGRHNQHVAGNKSSTWIIFDPRGNKHTVHVPTHQS